MVRPRGSGGAGVAAAGGLGHLAVDSDRLACRGWPPAQPGSLDLEPGIICVLLALGAGTESSSGSNSAETSPNLSVVPGPSGSLAGQPLALDEGAVGGAQVGQDPDVVPALQLGVHGADARIADDHVVVVRPPDIDHRHLDRQPPPLELSAAERGATPAAPPSATEEWASSLGLGPPTGKPCMVSESRLTAPGGG